MVGWLVKQESTRDVDVVIDLNLDEEGARARIRCPLCEWQPDESSRWSCQRTPTPEGALTGTPSHRTAGGLLRWMRHRVEHVFDTWALSGLSVPVALDQLPAVQRLVAA